MEQITLNRHIFEEILRQYDENNAEATPINLNAFIDYVFFMHGKEDKKNIKCPNLDRGYKTLNKKAEIIQFDVNSKI